LRYRKGILLVTLGVSLLALISCGKKAPPFLPEKIMPLKVARLEAASEKGAVVLRGSIVDPEGKSRKGDDVAGCRVYHARYPVNDPPCEGCPITYGGFKVIKGEVTKEKEFYCPVPGIETKGIHFFEVRLIGRNGAIGTASNRVKLRIDD